MSTDRPCCAHELKWGWGDFCDEPAWEGSDYCILHIDLPEKSDPEFETIVKAKKERTQEKIDAGDFNFERATLAGGFSAEGKELESANFYRATFNGDASFNGTTFRGDPRFDRATFNGDAWFWRARFELTKYVGRAGFDRATFNGVAEFFETTFNSLPSFNGATFNSFAGFQLARFSDDASFTGATFNGQASFNSATFDGSSWSQFKLATFAKELDIRDATFRSPTAQEMLCRAAKQSWDRVGDRLEADYCFYREMEGNRKRKPRFERYLELPVQYIFGYGVHPERLFAAFVITVIAFGFFYLYSVPSVSPAQSFSFSFTATILPGSGLQNETFSTVWVAVLVQALFGLLVWGTFIATLTRKFGR